jgi:predicted amidohydrolase
MTHAPYVAAAVNFRTAFLRPRENVDRMVGLIGQAAREEPRTRLIVFPECATIGLPGPGAQDRASDLRQRFVQAAERVPGPTGEALGRAARRHGLYVATGFVEADPVLDGVVYNSSLLVGPGGEVVAVHRKVHTNGIFKAGDEIRAHATALGVVGLSICYDLWFPEFLRLQALAGCQVHINMTANQPIFGIGSTHVPIVRAAECALYIVSSNRVGDDRPDGGLAYMGASSVVAPLGEVLAMGSHDREEVVYGEIDLARIARARMFLPTYNSRRTDLYDVIALRPSVATHPHHAPVTPTPPVPEVAREQSG